MRLRGKLAELMIETAPDIYRKMAYVNHKGEKVLYVRLKKALYGIMQSALLFYNRLVSALKEKGFTVNPYDPCVENWEVEGSQMTVVWHVDDMKVSHANPDMVTELVNWVQIFFLVTTLEF